MITLLSPDDFTARRRDPLLQYDVYEARTQDLLRRIPSAARNLASPQWLLEHDEGDIMQMTNQRAKYALDLLTLAYSAGAEVGTLAGTYPALLDHFEEYAHYSDAYNATPIGRAEWAPHLALGDVDFYRALRLLCFAILLGRQDTVPRVLAILDYGNECKDGLLERLAAPYVARRTSPPATCLRGLPYARTLAIFDASASERPQLMHDYLAGWYKASRRQPYHGRDAKPGFLGYWSWEAAAIIRVLDIDDAPFRHLPFYPRDLANYRTPT